jgi:hypothetical protein
LSSGNVADEEDGTAIANAAANKLLQKANEAKDNAAKADAAKADAAKKTNKDDAKKSRG